MSELTQHALASPAVMTISGSDSSGGAGVHADLKTFSSLDVYGTSTITCVMAQNPSRVSNIVPVPAQVVGDQIESICEAYPIAVAKTGMLYSADIIRVVACEELREGIPILVVDPVMIAASGARLLQGDAMEALCTELIPLARVVTPDLHEAEILCGQSIGSTDELRAAARVIGERYDVACVVKGAHLGGDEVVDVLWDEGEEHVFTGPRIVNADTHGAGCTFSAALTAYLARSELMSVAVGLARDFVYQSLQRATTLGSHRPLHFNWTRSELPTI